MTEADTSVAVEESVTQSNAAENPSPLADGCDDDLESKTSAPTEALVPDQSGPTPSDETAPSDEAARLAERKRLYPQGGGPQPNAGRPKKEKPTAYPTESDPPLPLPTSPRSDRAKWYTEQDRVISLRRNWLRENDARLTASEKSAQGRRLAEEETRFKGHIKFLEIFDGGSQSSHEESEKASMERLAMCDVTPEDGE